VCVCVCVCVCARGRGVQRAMRDRVVASGGLDYSRWDKWVEDPDDPVSKVCVHCALLRLTLQLRQR
jgi:hypothetical protein